MELPPETFEFFTSHDLRVADTGEQVHFEELVKKSGAIPAKTGRRSRSRADPSGPRCPAAFSVISMGRWIA